MEETELRLWEKVRILRERLDMLRRQVADAEKQEKLLARREEWYVGTYRRAKHACMHADRRSPLEEKCERWKRWKGSLWASCAALTENFSLTIRRQVLEARGSSGRERGGRRHRV